MFQDLFSEESEDEEDSVDEESSEAAEDSDDADSGENDSEATYMENEVTNDSNSIMS